MNALFSNDLSIFAFPVNLLAALLLLAGTWFLHRYYAHTLLVRRLTRMSSTLLVTGIIIFILIIEGIWALQLFKTWVFIVFLLLLLLILGLITLKKVHTFSKRNLLFLLNHGGLWLALTAALFGAPDREEYKMIAPLHQTEYNALDQNGTLHPLPFTVRLDQFELEYYPQQGNAKIPKRFCSTLTLQSKEKIIQVPVEVNQPVHFKGYSLYQDGYDHSRGADSAYSILLVVRDPWIPLVYAGIFMLLAGAAGLIIVGPLKQQKS